MSMSDRPRLGDQIATIKGAIPKMIAGIKELAKAELVPSAKHAGIGGGLFGGAGASAFFAFKCLLWAATFGVANFYHYVAGRDWFTALALAFVTFAVIALVLAAVMGLIGWLQVKKVKMPTATIEETKASISALSSSVTAGLDDVKAEDEARKNPLAQVH
ncbi:phage holin family protein [Propionibacterium freudenreichii]|nr:phage holin family protein [Propionibacterium freudenreichii]PWM94929.1 MAG: phage holin family protein [Propionibacterium sp.]CUW06548.1 PF07332 family protein [Propionibacterium freudenreichii subsp. shermanii]MCT2975495.1 phage holin family protein [Propionibacterium freudenreichii]MCT2978747.1 phage holin family protein [Propionibacterium freudenreichii]